MPSERWSGRRIAAAAVAGAVLGLLAWWLLRPTPVAVDMARIERGPMTVAVEEDGRTRVRERYEVVAPVAARYEPAGLEEGDSVTAGRVVARLDPGPLDPRAREQARARLEAARASAGEAEAGVRRARAALAEAERKLERIRPVAERGGVAPETVDELETAVATRRQELAAARSRARAAGFEVEVARSALAAAEPGEASGPGLELRAPSAGRVLTVHQRTPRDVAAGTPLLELGDLSTLEVVVDVLSADAVRIRPGDRVELVAWGGDDTLRARVRRVEPSGYTKVSPLGVEEQRVDVVADLLGPAPGLGDRYRVEARIVTWEGDDVLRVPLGALFRGEDGGWRVFAVVGGRARLRTVEIGRRTPEAAEVLEGLEAGDTVVVYPDDRIEDGTRVEPREPDRIR